MRGQLLHQAVLRVSLANTAGEVVDRAPVRPALLASTLNSTSLPLVHPVRLARTALLWVPHPAHLANHVLLGSLQTTPGARETAPCVPVANIFR